MKTLKDFASMFISPRLSGKIASTIAAFEDVYEGPAVRNTTAENLHERMKTLETELKAEGSTPGFGADSYRFKMPLLMSGFYKYIRQRAVRDAEVWNKAWAIAEQSGDIAAMKKALAEVDISPNPKLRDELWALTDECYERIQWQTSVSKHHAQHYSRGGFMDQMDVPLCDAYWLELQLDKLSGLDGAALEEKLAALRNRKNPGPGGKYISFGEPDSMRYIKLDGDWWDEPESITIPRLEHTVGMWETDMKRTQAARMDNNHLDRVASILAYYDGKVEIDVDGLVPGAPYELRIVYSMRFGFVGRDDIPTHIHVGGKRLACLGFDPADPFVYRYNVEPGMVGDDGVLEVEMVKDPIPRGTGIAEMWLKLRN